MKESALAHKYLDGLKGIEIGGSSHNAFGLDTVNVDITRESLASKKGADLGYKPMHVDFLCQGDNLPFDDNSYDFVVSSHVIEHFYDPIKALLEWQRVARKYIFIICPHKDRMFDKDKEETTIGELLERCMNPIEQTNFSHQSYWTTSGFVKLCIHGKFNIIEVQDVDDKVGNGFTVLIKL